MAKVEKDFFGTYHVDVTEEVTKARRDERFRRDMSQVGSNLDSDMGKAARDGVAGAAALGVGAAAVGVGAATNLRFRYKLQAFLHFPFSFLVSFCVFINIALRLRGDGGTSTADGQSTMVLFLIYWALAGVTSILWSLLYINKRTKPKLARLEY